MHPLWKLCHLMCSSFSTSFRLMVKIRLTPCSFVDAKSASLGTPAGGNSSPAPLRLLSPANPFHWASPGSAHTLRHRCGLPLLGVAVRRVRRHLMCNSFSTSFRLMVSIRDTPCSFVGAKSAFPQNALPGIPRPLPCASSPNRTRFAGLRFDFQAFESACQKRKSIFFVPA